LETHSFYAICKEKEMVTNYNQTTFVGERKREEDNLKSRKRVSSSSS
jgi:hypothetical protein